jgi:hypothetical protein
MSANQTRVRMVARATTWWPITRVLALLNGKDITATVSSLIMCDTKVQQHIYSV